MLRAFLRRIHACLLDTQRVHVLFFSRVHVALRMCTHKLTWAIASNCILKHINRSQSAQAWQRHECWWVVCNAGVDHIVVQSYDGQLTFFEQEVQSFSRLLPDFLLPGPLAYLAASDSFITATAGLELVAYRYSSIAAASWEPAQGRLTLDAMPFWYGCKTGRPAFAAATAGVVTQPWCWLTSER